MSVIGLINAVFLTLPLIITVYLGIHSWRRRNIPGAISFMISMLIVGAWCATSLLVVVNSDEKTALFWVKMMLAIVPFLPAFIVVSVLQTNVRDIPITRRWIVVLLVVPTITAILSMTSNSQSIYLYNLKLTQSGSQNVGWTNQYGPWAVVHLAYSYAVVGFSLVLLIRQFIRMRYHTYRMRSILLLVGVSLPFVTNMINTLVSDVHYFVTPMVFNISAPILFWALFRYRLFEVLPIARDRAFEHINDAIVIVDMEHRIVDVNPSAALLAKSNAAKLLEIQLFQAFVSFKDALMPLLESTVSHKLITLNMHNEERYFDVTISPITRDQEVVGKLIIMQDRTEQHSAEMRAHRLEVEHERLSTLSAFIEAASHEFRTPLSVIKNSTFIANRTDDPAKRTEKLDQIDDQVNRISQLVDALLSIVRLDASTQLELSPIDINSIVEMASEKVKAEATAHKVSLELAMTPRLPLIKGNTFHLTEAIYATIHNAVRYTPADGKVNIATTLHDSEIVVTIQDTGVGIDEEHLPHIFDAFYRVDKARTTAGFGTGLAIASRVINLHSGQLEVESKVGEGTTMLMKFPVAG
jgi:signal transduction histidine kinase